jgi:hypothetical protein
MAGMILFVSFMAVLWFFGLCTLMLGAWCAVDKYMNGTQKDRRVIGVAVFLLAVVLSLLTAGYR